MRVGFIGLGSQGGPMAKRIIEAGFATSLWARRPASLEPFADTPAKVAGSPAELAADSDLVCLCVVSDTDVDEITGGDDGVLAGLKSGGVIAVHSTVHPKTCHDLAEKAAVHGISVIDAPVSGGAPAVAEGRLLVMVGGDADVVARCRPVFESYADPIVHLGDLGSGQTTKLLNNLLFTANLGTAAGALALGEALGVLPGPPKRGHLPRQREQLRAQRSWRRHQRIAPACRHGGRTAAEGRPAGGRRRGRRLRCRRGCAGRRRRHAVAHGTSTVRIGFVGAGRMGRPMVTRLVAAGHDVRALGRSDEKRSCHSRIGC